MKTWNLGMWIAFGAIIGMLTGNVGLWLAISVAIGAATSRKSAA